MGTKVQNRTYTNAATDEIISRLNYSPLFHVSTIHSFVWNVIQSYQSDIKKYYLRFKEEEKAELEEKINKARKNDGKTYLNNVDKFDKVIKLKQYINLYIIPMGIILNIMLLVMQK